MSKIKKGLTIFLKIYKIQFTFLFTYQEHDPVNM